MTAAFRDTSGDDAKQLFPYITSFLMNNATVGSFGGKHKAFIRFHWNWARCDK